MNKKIYILIAILMIVAVVFVFYNKNNGQNIEVTLPTNLSSAEFQSMREEILNAVIRNSVEGIEARVVFVEQKGDWYIFDVDPKSETIDPAQLFVHKVNGKYEVIGPGTAFPDLYEKYPEIFE